METIKWQDPPEAGEPGPSYAAKAQEFKENPGTWGILKSYPTEKRNTANVFARALKLGAYASFTPSGAWEARTATEANEEGTRVVNVYVRYLGEG